MGKRTDNRARWATSDSEPPLVETDEEATRQASKALVEQTVKSNSPVEGLIRLDAILKATVDARVNRLLVETENVACKKGCGYCCCVSVSTFPFEVFAIVDHVERTWSTIAKWKLRCRIRAYRKKKVRLQKGEQHPWCPFLIDNCCSIHVVRPTICRTHHSTDLRACIQNRITRPPGAQPFYEATFPIYDGVYEGLGDRSGLPGGLDMAVAVGIALEKPESLSDFIEGQDPFVGARRSVLNG